MYEWDNGKCEINRRLRGFGFEIIHDFDWATAVVDTDTRKDYGEDRYRAFGLIGDRVYAVAFTFRGDNIRVISIRRVHAKEGRKYGFG